MSIFVIVIPVIVIFAIGYWFYGRFLTSLFQCRQDRQTPAQTRYDGIDYIPAKDWFILFGHHFSSIAGAAPIIGPVLAVAYWGWAPAVLWIVIGSVFIGGLHDFGSLMISVRSRGDSIAQVAKEVISPRAKVIFSLFLFLALIFVVAVFLDVCANTFTADGRIVIPSFGLIFIALLVGNLLYRVKLNQFYATGIGLVLLFIAVVIGSEFPVNIDSLSFWMVILLIYAFIASILPVQVLLQPRDYLSSFLLFFGILFGYLGLFISRPDINLPAFISWDTSQGWLWPMLLVTIACGAISGFHSLIASGTTSKQLPNEKYAKRIGYGAMLTEGLLAILALSVIISGMADLGNLKSVIAQGGPIKAFGTGFGKITSPILGNFGGLVAVTVLNAFVLTTLDTVTRIARYILSELTKIKNRFLITSLVVFLSGWLAWGGKWKQLWPVFGASNQLVATLALLVISCWLLSKKRKVLPSLAAAFFMLITTVAALIYESAVFFKGGKYVLFGICMILLGLSAYIVVEVVTVFLKQVKKWKN